MRYGCERIARRILGLLDDFLCGVLRLIQHLTSRIPWLTEDIPGNWRRFVSLGLTLFGRCLVVCAGAARRARAFSRVIYSRRAKFIHGRSLCTLDPVNLPGPSELPITVTLEKSRRIRRLRASLTRSSAAHSKPRKGTLARDPFSRALSVYGSSLSGISVALAVDGGC